MMPDRLVDRQTRQTQRAYTERSLHVHLTPSPLATQSRPKRSQVGLLEHVQQRAAQRADVVVGSLRRLQLCPQRMQQRMELAAIVSRHIVQRATVCSSSRLQFLTLRASRSRLRRPSAGGPPLKFPWLRDREGVAGHASQLGPADQCPGLPAKACRGCAGVAG